MDWKIWLAFGVGIFFGACGMALLIGYVSESLRIHQERCKIFSQDLEEVVPFFDSLKVTRIYFGVPVYKKEKSS